MIIDSPKLLGNPVEAAIVKGNMSGAQSIDLATGSYVTGTVTGNTTITLSSSATTAGIRGVLLKLTNPGAFTITFSPVVKWAAGVFPTFTASGVDFVNILTDDGITFYGSLAIKDAK